MRPRVFPAEDTPGRRRRSGRPSRFNEAAGIPRGRQGGKRPHNLDPHASMRPRVFPAEDFWADLLSAARAAASMRPRVFPAEDGAVPAGRQRKSRASMRPRVFPAEDSVTA